MKLLARIRRAIWTVIILAIGFRRHGLTEFQRKVDAIKEQADFWYPLIVELQEERKKAAITGNVNRLFCLETQYRLALKRFEEEVAQPFDNLHRK